MRPPGRDIPSYQVVQLMQRAESVRERREAIRARWRERIARLRGALPSRPITPLEETR